MMGRWIDESRELLKALDEAASKKGEDRLELVNSMILALIAINRSIGGWMSWMQSLDFMSRFSEDELREMKQEFIKEARGFVEYDTEVSIKHKDKESEIREEERDGPSTGIIV